MIEPTQKAPGIEALLTCITGGLSRAEIIRSAACMTCHGSALNFRDKLSEREYAISGRCQDCQDEFYGDDE